jgi:SAM-dependent methyltransferase
VEAWISVIADGDLRRQTVEILRMTPLEQHQREIEKNRIAWEKKPHLRKIYAGFYERIIALIDPSVPGPVVEIGSGIGNLKSFFPGAISTDLFPNPGIDMVFDGYEMPFENGAVSHLVLVDVFHHLRAPRAFLKEARRVLAGSGRVIILDPYISLLSFPAYAIHHEGVNWRAPIFMGEDLAKPRDYYTGQGNATRLFFLNESPEWLPRWTVFHAEAFASFRYLLSGGYSKPALYPEALSGSLKRLDTFLSRWPRLFAARCLIGLTPREI